MNDKTSPNVTRASIFESLLSIKDPRERVQKFLNLIQGNGYNFWDSKVMQAVKLVSVGEGRAEFEFTVTAGMCNNSGTLHGGCAATLLDDLTSIPSLMIAKPGFLDQGTVSRTLTCTYLRGVKAGEKLRVVCEVVGAGKTLSHFRGDLITEDGKVAVSCIHDKANVHKSKL